MRRRVRRFRKYVVLRGVVNGRRCTAIARHKDLTIQNGKGIHKILHKVKNIFLLRRKEKTLMNRDLTKIHMSDYYDLNTGELIPEGVYDIDQWIDGTICSTNEVIFGDSSHKDGVIKDQESQLREVKDELHLKSERFDLVGSKDKLTQSEEDDMERMATLRKKLYLPKEE